MQVFKFARGQADKSYMKKGFSLVGVLVASGIMSILIMGSMGFMANQLKEQQKMVEKGEIQSLKNEMGMLLDSEKNCRASLAGDGGFGSPSTPIKFKKTAINDQKSTEGLEVELYTSSQDGKKRSAKMFSATDSKFKFYGSLEILSIKLFMDKGREDDYPESEGHEDIGTLKITVKGLEKETSFDISLSVWMKTDADNNTTLLSCARSSSSAPKCGTNQKFHPACGCIRKNALYDLRTCELCLYGYSERCKKCIEDCHLRAQGVESYSDSVGWGGGTETLNTVWMEYPVCSCGHVRIAETPETR